MVLVSRNILRASPKCVGLIVIQDIPVQLCNVAGNLIDRTMICTDVFGIQIWLQASWQYHQIGQQYRIKVQCKSIMSNY